MSTHWMSLLPYPPNPWFETTATLLSKIMSRNLAIHILCKWFKIGSTFYMHLSQQQKPLQLKLHLICSCQLCLPGKPPLFDHIIHLRPLKVCFWYQLHSLAYDLPLSALSGDSLILWSDWSGPDKSRLLIGQHHFAFWMSKMPLYLLYPWKHRLLQFLWSKSVVP